MKYINQVPVPLNKNNWTAEVIVPINKWSVEFSKWLKNYNYSVDTSNDDKTIILFENKEDAIAFKLRFKL